MVCDIHDWHKQEAGIFFLAAVDVDTINEILSRDNKLDMYQQFCEVIPTIVNVPELSCDIRTPSLFLWQIHVCTHNGQFTAILNL